MISLVRGTISSIKEYSVTVDMGPVSFSIQIPRAQGFQIDQAVKLYTYLHWNQEQGPSLFGFSSELERELFILVIGCSGIGPRIALSILDHMTPRAFVDAVQQGNEDALSAIHGIGAKKAEFLIVHLKHKITKLIESSALDPAELSAATNHFGTLAEVLGSLNYSRAEVAQALKFVRESHSEQTEYTFDRLLRVALSFLSKRA